LHWGYMIAESTEIAEKVDYLGIKIQ
jgi:hypothetical protein